MPQQTHSKSQQNPSVKALSIILHLNFSSLNHKKTNFEAIFKLETGRFRAISGDFRRFWVILTHQNSQNCQNEPFRVTKIQKSPNLQFSPGLTWKLSAPHTVSQFSSESKSKMKEESSSKT